MAEHTLQTPWCFWYDKKLTYAEREEARAKGIKIRYKDQLKRLGTFSTVEDFWRHYVHMKRPSELPVDTNVYLFRDGCHPSWEAYPAGGCWILKVKKATGVMGKLWQDLLFAVIGELFEEPNVVGITMAIRSKHDMLSVWNKDNFHAHTRFLIGKKLREILHLEERTMIEYKFHSKSMQDKSTYSNADAFVYTGGSGGGGGRGGRGRRGGRGGGRGGRRSAGPRDVPPRPTATPSPPAASAPAPAPAPVAST